ncbi:MAG: hypothetical protein NTW93_07805 [Phycisphaerae bacterium]|nr:hypothetical protein [Phycisphaerae bacterium]
MNPSTSFDDAQDKFASLDHARDRQGRQLKVAELPFVFVFAKNHS